MFLASGLIQASHMVFYGFGTLHWRAHGISDGVIGWLWAEGVIAEIVLFWYGAPLLRRFRPAGLMLLGGGLGAVRWIATGLTADVTFLVGLQALHGFSFGATHLGAMHFLKDHARAGLSATAQGLHSALAMGLLGGLTMMGAGPLFGAVGAGAFQVMAVMAALGAVIAWRLQADRIAAGPDGSRR
jgi:PPP family 3-phenylpropionic acid transporter